MHSVHISIYSNKDRRNITCLQLIRPDNPETLVIGVFVNLFFLNWFLNQPHSLMKTQPADRSGSDWDKPRGEQLDLGSLQCWYKVGGMKIPYSHYDKVVTYFYCQRCFLSFFPVPPPLWKDQCISCSVLTSYMMVLWGKDLIIPTPLFNSCSVSESYSNFPFSIIGNCKRDFLYHLRTWTLSECSLYQPLFDCEFILRGWLLAESTQTYLYPSSKTKSPFRNKCQYMPS
jgi:hypothetical protein